MIDNAAGVDVGSTAKSNIPWPMMEFWTRQYLSDLGELIAGARQPFPARLTATEIEPSGVISGIFLPIASALAEGEARTLVVLRAAQIGLAIAEYRRDHGELPTRLDSLVSKYLPSVPVDPFDGQPLRYHIDESQYIVYSVDEDLSDDGGDVRADPHNWQDKATDHGTIFRRR